MRRIGTLVYAKGAREAMHVGFYLAMNYARSRTRKLKFTIDVIFVLLSCGIAQI